MNTSPDKLTLNVVTGENLCSFKNRKRVTKTGALITEPGVKQRQGRLESAIESALSSAFRTESGAMDLDLQSLWQIRLSALLDDSLAQIPEFSFGVEYVEKGQEGVRIEIEEIE